MANKYGIDVADCIAETSRFLYQKGWSPATSSNYSMRIDEASVAITTSGKDKGLLTPDDVMAVNLEGQPLSDGKRSAETLLHTQMYSRDATIGAVLHTHSIACTVLSRHFSDKESITLAGYELLKAFNGITTHETAIEIPIFDNEQYIPRLCQKVESWLDTHPQTYAYIIRGHGCYTWGQTMPECRRHLEALETLLQCEMEHIKLSANYGQ